nr:unnamed protein product [Digitaria exilis]
MAITHVAAPLVAAGAHTAANLSTACRRGTSRWALLSRPPVGTTGGFRWLRRRAQTRARARRGARASGRGRCLVVVAEFGGTYEDGFEDVHKNIINYFTYKATHTERQDVAERVMITRLHLYGKWIKECDHAMMYERISKENLDIMLQRLLETVVWPTDDTSTGEYKD